MVRLFTANQNYFDVPGSCDHTSGAFHAIRNSLVSEIVADRAWTGMTISYYGEDGRTDLVVKGEADHITNLLLTLHYHGAGLFQVEADTKGELALLREEFSQLPAVSIELAETV